jgi:hypothetical protein
MTTPTFTTCPRCDHDALSRVATAPVEGAWDVLRCDLCFYMWRTTEPERRTRRASYPPAFRLTREDIDNAIEVPPVPPRR